MRGRNIFANKISKYPRLQKVLKPWVVAVVLAVFITSLLLFLYQPKTSAQTFITSGTTWTVPSDWSNNNNTIEVIGAGGGAGGGFADSSGSGGGGGGGGGGGAYSKVTNVTLTPGDVVSIAVGTGGGGGGSSVSGTVGGDTYVCNSATGCSSITDSSVIVGAKGGAAGSTGTGSTGGPGGTGGAAGSGVGAVKNSGGDGASPSGPASAAGSGGGGGGGAAGLNASGNNGTTNSATISGDGGRGDGTSGGAGGTGNGGAGTAGTEYDATHGSGGGGAGGNGIGNGSGSAGGNGGAYGAGGGAGGGNGSKRGAGGSGGDGNQGIIRVVYNYTTQSDYRWRLDDGNESTGTSLAAQNTAATIKSSDNVRLRTLIKNQGDITSYDYRLEYSPYTGACTAWTAVPATATTEHFNMITTGNYTDQSASTNVATGPGAIVDPAGYTFTAGKSVSSPSNTASAVSLGGSTFTELEYALQPNSNATSTAYCFRVTNAGTPLEGYTNFPVLNINYVPSTPSIYSVVDGTTNVPRLPTFQLKSTDINKDYLRYVVEVCQDNTWPCANGARTYDQTSSQACWNLQNAQSTTAFASDGILSSSTMAYCQMPTADLLLPSTTYYMRAKAIDPGGTNTYSAYSSVATFTTSSLEVQINGGTNITGGTKIGN